MNRSFYYLEVKEREPHSGDWQQWFDWLARETNARCWDRQYAFKTTDGHGYSTRPMLTSEGNGMLQRSHKRWTYRDVKKAQRPEPYCRRWKRLAGLPVNAPL